MVCVPKNGVAKLLTLALARKCNMCRFWIYVSERNNNYYISILKICAGVACEQSKAPVY